MFVLTPVAAESRLSVTMFSLFRKHNEPRSELTKLVDEEAAKKSLREQRRQWAIEMATYVGEGESVDDMLRAAKRFYVEAFGESWDA